MKKPNGLAPHRPSKRHVIKVEGIGESLIEICLRCGSRYRPNRDFGIGALYCHPKPEWLREHPDDDRTEF